MADLKFVASGKLLLFGEYLVLRGSKSFSIPLSAAQSVDISTTNSEDILWECLEGDQKWMEIRFSSTLEIQASSSHEKALIVQKLLRIIQQEKPSIELSGSYFRFHINFFRNYGFGTSSTFISLLSQWSGVDPYYLLEKSFGGSGFDIATATAEFPIIYKIPDRIISQVSLSQEITDHLLFIYSGKKQRSSKEILSFNAVRTTENDVNSMDRIIESAVRSSDIETFEKLMMESEALLSPLLKAVPVKIEKYSDYPYAIKSLGAWGGDFIMATFRNEEEGRKYFYKKGMHPVFNYRELIKK